MISVLMPAFNAEKYIGQAIESVLNQSFRDFELIIIDDGSIDNTHHIITSYQDERIRYYQNEENKGLSFVRNRLVNLATHDFIAFLDSDDYSDINRLKIQYDYLVQNEQIDFVASCAVVLTEDGKQNKSILNFALSSEELKTHLLFYNPIVTSTVMFRKCILPDELFRNTYPPCEDYDLWSRMLFQNKGIILSAYLTVYRSYNTSVSHRKKKDAVLNRNKIILNQLDFYFSSNYSVEEQQIHLSLVDFSIRNKISDISDLQNWISKLLTLNQTLHHFDETILKQVLYERILKKLLRLKQYNFAVFKTLLHFKKQLQPTLTMELRKKEAAIFLFSFLHKQIVSL